MVALEGLPEVAPGDDLAALIAPASHAERLGQTLNDDVIVVAHKVVSKAEGRTRRLADVHPASPRASSSRPTSTRTHATSR